MFIPVYLFWNYLSPFPWWLGPLLQVAGIFLMGTTRLTFRMFPKWGNRYYLFSAFARPLGIILIAWAWVEMASVRPDLWLPGSLAANPGWLVGLVYAGLGLFMISDRYLRKFFFPMAVITMIMLFTVVVPIIIPMIGLVLALAFSVWSIFALGLRRSFLYSKNDDQLVTRGPYQSFRHPQLLAAMLITVFGIAALSGGYPDRRIISFQLLNVLVLIAGLYLITVSEDRDLEKRFGVAFLDFKKAVPGFWSFRAKGKIMAYGNSTGLILLAAFISAIAFGIGHVGGKAGAIFYAEEDPNYWREFYSRQHLANRILYDLKQSAQTSFVTDGSFPETLPIADEAMQEWQRRDSECPFTIFYCGQMEMVPKNYSAHVIPRRRVQMNKPVDKLPFNLVCTGHKVEIAAAFNCDQDDFPEIQMLVFEGNTAEMIEAADDRDNQYADEIKPRLKK